MLAAPIDFSRKALVLITGASKGIGRCIAVEISKNLAQGSILVLIARSEEGLEETKSLIYEVDRLLNVYTYSIDLAQAPFKDYEKIIDDVLKSADGCATGVIFHNAASTGEVVQTTDLTDMAVWRDYFNLNLFSVSVLNSIFIRKLQGVIERLVVVNVTSLCGRMPFKNLAMYGGGKAAREIFFKVLALEEPQVTVLNYSPGCVDTDMVDGILVKAQSDEVKESFRKIKDTSILTPEQTVTKLLSALETGGFKTGCVIDYFDQV